MHPVQHFEIPYRSHARAKKFYFDAFGWQLFDVPGTGYTFATTVPLEKNGMPKRAGAINGGLTPRTKDLTAPTLLIHVGDVQANLARIVAAGGSVVVPPTPMGPVTYARVRDPEGNLIGIIEDRAEGQKKPAKRGGKTPAKGGGKKAATKAAKKKR
jgi:uncharacterized protein